MKASPKTRKGKELLVNVAVMAGAVALFFIVLELVLWIGGYDNQHGFPEGLIRLDETVDFGLTPGFQGRHKGPDFEVEIEINQQGFRDHEWGESSGMRIMALGDSYTFGHGVEFNDSYLFLVEEALREDGLDVTIYKMGVSGYGTDNQEALYREWRDRLEPDVVLLIMSPNDIVDNIRWGEAAQPQSDSFAERLFAVHSALRKRIKSYDFIYARVQNLPLFSSLKRDVDLPENFMYTFFAQENEQTSLGWQKTFSLLDSIIEDARRRGIVVAVSMAPHGNQLRPERVEIIEETAASRGTTADLKKANRVVKTYVESEEAIYIDTMPAFEEAENVSALFYPLDGHWNAAGHMLVAEELRENLIKGVLPVIGDGEESLDDR